MVQANTLVAQTAPEVQGWKANMHNLCKTELCSHDEVIITAILHVIKDSGLCRYYKHHR